MHKKLLPFLLTLGFLGTQAQEDKLYFSEVLSTNLPKYNAQADEAILAGDMEGAKALFESLIKDGLQGSYMDDLTFEPYKTRLHSIGDFNKPTILLTYDSWCIPNAGEIPVLNKMAARYGDMMSFVVLYWDNREVVRKKAKQFDRKIHVVYVDIDKNEHMRTAKLLKQALGLSLAYVLSADGEVLDINRRPPNILQATTEDALAINFSFLANQVASIHLDLNIDLKDIPESFATWE